MLPISHHQRISSPKRLKIPNRLPDPGQASLPANPIHFIQNLNQPLRGFDLLQPESCLSSPVDPFGKSPRRILRGFLKPEVFQVNQQKPGVALRQKSQAGSHDFTLRLTAPQETLPSQKPHQSAIGAPADCPFALCLLRGKQAEIETVTDVLALPMSAEWRHVMSVHAGHRVSRGSPQRRSWVWPLFVLEHVQLQNPALSHHGVYLGRDCAKIFADESRSMPM